MSVHSNYKTLSVTMLKCKREKKQGVKLQTVVTLCELFIYELRI